MCNITTKERIKGTREASLGCESMIEVCCQKCEVRSECKDLYAGKKTMIRVRPIKQHALPSAPEQKKEVKPQAHHMGRKKSLGDSLKKGLLGGDIGTANTADRESTESTEGVSTGLLPQETKSSRSSIDAKHEMTDLATNVVNGKPNSLTATDL
jgi:hypothetical protein